MSSAYSRQLYPTEFRLFAIKLIKKLKRIGLSHMLCGIPVEVERTLVDPKGEKIYKVLREKKVR